MSDLSIRTAAALADSRNNDANSYAALLREWLQEAPLLGNLYRSRALVGRLLDDQKGMIGALQVGIYHAERFPDDGPIQTFKDIALKRISESVKCP